MQHKTHFLKLVTFLLLTVFLSSCNQKNSTDKPTQSEIEAKIRDSIEQVVKAELSSNTIDEPTKAATKPVSKEQTLAQIENQLLAKERKTPWGFMSFKYDYSINKLKKRGYIYGSIYNTATMATFKDVQIVVKCYSKTGTLIKTFYETYYEYIKPKSKVKINYKFKLPKGIDKVEVFLNDIKQSYE